jgi:hypothetical protein
MFEAGGQLFAAGIPAATDELTGVRVVDLRSSLRQQNPSYHDEFFNRTHSDIRVHGMTMPWSSRPLSPTPEAAVT